MLCLRPVWSGFWAGRWVLSSGRPGARPAGSWSVSPPSSTRLRELFGLPIPVPDRHQQVPLWWRSFYSQKVTALLYGFGLGIGYLTYLSFGTYFVVTIAAFASGDPLVGAALCAPFGLGRALSVLVANRKLGAEKPSGIDRIDNLASTRWPKVLNATTLLLVGVAAIAVSL